MPNPDSFPAFLVRKSDDGAIAAGIERISLDDLPPGQVVIDVEFSSLNYKDALASQGHPGVARDFPHVPGIDCAGRVHSSTTSELNEGDPVLVTGYDLGAAAWGGYSNYVRVPAEWVVPMPAELTARECMLYGTAGFTAAQCVQAIVTRDISPDAGPVVVTGATGGVGSLAVAILAKLGYEVFAATGKRDRHDWLREMGAKEIVGRDEVNDDSPRPLLKSRWAAAVDTVGGHTLATLLRSTQHRAVVAACGLVGGDQLPLTVYPFLLRGVTLAGIDSAQCPRAPRLEIWRHLATDWRVDQLESLASEATLDELPSRIEAILAGKIAGRTLVRPITGGG